MPHEKTPHRRHHRRHRRGVRRAHARSAENRRWLGKPRCALGCGALNLWHELKMKRKDLEGLATTASAYPKSVTASARNPRSRGKLLRARQTTAPPTMRDLPTASRT